ncbi:MAG: GNAT family N-acetyltransferase [Actinobacteria bacterium]|nr:GNAT family N-acetyltransferase [Actinomycetota bacterium]
MEGSRRAEVGDVPRIVELALALRDEIKPIRGGDLWAAHEALPEPLDRSYADYLARERTCVVVGTIDETVMGFGAGEVQELHDGSRLGVIIDLYVEPGAREIGVGEEMVNQLLDFFGAAGCVGVDAWALPGHRMTKNFFEDHAFVSRGIVVHRRLGPGA